MKKKLENFKVDELVNLHLIFGGNGTLSNLGDDDPIGDDDDDTLGNSASRPRGGSSSSTVTLGG